MTTNLEKLIDEQVMRSVAEALARDILQDKEFRARIEALIKQVFEKTLVGLNREAE